MRNPQPTPAGRGGIWFPRGHILHDYLESRVMPVIIGPVGRGDLQYTAMWKAAQRLTKKPVKFGTVIGRRSSPSRVQDRHYKSVPERMSRHRRRASTRSMHELADAGCPVIQIEEPQIHLLAVRNIVDKVINPAVHGRGVQPHGEGPARQDRGLVRTPAGAIRRSSACSPRCRATSPRSRCYNKVDADVITFESASSGGIDLEAIGKIITDKKICIGVIDHHTLQVERPEEVADADPRARSSTSRPSG